MGACVAWPITCASILVAILKSLTAATAKPAAKSTSNFNFYATATCCCASKELLSRAVIGWARHSVRTAGNWASDLGGQGIAVQSNFRRESDLEVTSKR